MRDIETKEERLRDAFLLQLSSLAFSAVTMGKEAVSHWH